MSVGNIQKIIRLCSNTDAYAEKKKNSIFTVGNTHCEIHYATSLSFFASSSRQRLNFIPASACSHTCSPHSALPKNVLPFYIYKKNSRHFGEIGTTVFGWRVCPISRRCDGRISLVPPQFFSGATETWNWCRFLQPRSQRS